MKIGTYERRVTIEPIRSPVPLKRDADRPADRPPEKPAPARRPRPRTQHSP
jgi:hypothetical protein